MFIQFDYRADKLYVAEDSLVAIADRIAEEAHAGQLRRNTDLPYIIHPRAVARMVAHACGNEYQVAAALLHDVVEDGVGYTLDRLKHEFELPDIVVNYVSWLTNPSFEVATSRYEKCQIIQNRLREAPAEVQTIKICDVLHNCHDLLTNAKARQAKGYLREKIELVQRLDKVHPDLLEYANKQLEVRLQILINGH